MFQNSFWKQAENGAFNVALNNRKLHPFYISKNLTRNKVMHRLRIP